MCLQIIKLQANTTLSRILYYFKLHYTTFGSIINSSANTELAEVPNFRQQKALTSDQEHRALLTNKRGQYGTAFRTTQEG